MNDGDELYDDPARATDGNVTRLPTTNGRPIDEQPEQTEEPDGQQIWEFEEAERKIRWQDLVPSKVNGKSVPVKFHRKQKGKTLAATGAIPDPTVPIDTVCETILEDVKIAYTHDAELNIVEVNVTFNYAVRGTWSAKSEAARVAVGVA